MKIITIKRTKTHKILNIMGIKIKIKEKIAKIKKLGASYNLYDGIELLEASIRSIRKNVDYINVVYQSISNFNEKAPLEDIIVLYKLRDLKLIDNIILYTPDLNKSPGENEIKKRNIGLKDCLKNKCTHFITMDCDEFYKDDEFNYAKNFIQNHNIDTSYCTMYYYVKTPLFKFKETRRGLFVPFIYKITEETKFDHNAKSCCIVDSTRKLNREIKNCYFFSSNKLVMHHMAYVRKDLEKKFQNSTCNFEKNQQSKLNSLKNNIKNYKYPNDFIFYGEGKYEIEVVEDLFNIGFME